MGTFVMSVGALQENKLSVLSSIPTNVIIYNYLLTTFIADFSQCTFSDSDFTRKFTEFNM